MKKLLVLFVSVEFARADYIGLRTTTASLLRSLFTGEIVVFRSSEMPLFKVERAHLTEMPVEIPASRQGQEAGRRASREFLFKLCDHIHPELRQWVIIADSVGIALRNIDHLIPTDLPGPGDPVEVDFLWARVYEGEGGARDEAGPGLWAVRGEFLPMVLERWKEAWVAESAAGKEDERRIWTDVVRNLPIRKRAFERGEVLCPAVGAVDWRALCSAAYVCVPHWPEKEQWSFLQALYFGTYFGDETGLMLNILDP